jgi:hypothetical protein
LRLMPQWQTEERPALRRSLGCSGVRLERGDCAAGVHPRRELQRRHAARLQIPESR